jgi:hypothetical protein
LVDIHGKTTLRNVFAFTITGNKKYPERSFEGKNL